MKVCVPSAKNGGLEDNVGQHFGMVPVYTVLDTETDEVMIVENTSQHNGGVGLPPELLSEAGVNIMLCGGLGQKAVTMFSNFDIEVFVGAQGTVETAIFDWKAGNLASPNSENVCQDHGHDHDHDHNQH
ncbi:NifB/NifX family molybdenum-iron cluster-binding protein [Methanococcoides sp. NM1]|uniref:NifB/NifX family molybdenum-iron cluster-binding protein n=1 Tax=Methanococcoides sp. NM1 TaxID=1201013 RepID=UPI0010834993|nr:NifB/NifX family molybdenum-iron cluster-binding protein [Methanococcoides sp. NM1]